MINLKTTSSLTMVNAKTKPQLTPTFNGLNKFKYFLALGFLVTLSFNTFSADNSQQPNKKELNKEEFNKEAYLDLSKPYTHKQSNTTKKDNQATTFLKEVAGTVRSAIGSTNSNNANKLGSKITTDVENHLKNKAINTTEGLISDKANQFVNKFGPGRSEISIHKIESKNPTYSIKTIQPLSKLDSDSKELTFFQGQLASGENHGERRSTINLGIGHRVLIEDGTAIAGINLFSDYETKSRHKRLSLGLEYQRSNFSAHVNSYYPTSHRKDIGDSTEEALAGYDLKLTGQMPYLPWAKIKGTRYHWDGKQGSDIKGTIFGVEVELTPSINVELGTEKSNTADRASYMRLTTQLPLKDNGSFTNFSIDSKPFRNTGIVNLIDLNPVERSNKIRVEKVSAGAKIILGAYNATTVGASCTLYNASGVAVAGGSGITTTNGRVNLPDVKLSTNSLYHSVCTGGSYVDEATGLTANAPTLHSAVVYSGGDLVLVASPLSEIAYRMADTAAGNLSVIKEKIAAENDNVAVAFGLGNTDVIATIPTDLNIAVAQNDNSGRFGLILAAISQMGENSADASPNTTITVLVNDLEGMNGSRQNTIEGLNIGTQTVNVMTAINNLKTSGGNNNFTNGAASGNTGAAGSATGEGSIMGNLAILKISLYDGTSGAPTAQDYIYAGVTGVSSLAEVNARVALATPAKSDTTSEIQILVNNAPGVATTARSTLTANLTSVAADGKSTSTITMQAKDVNGNNLTTGGLTVTMSESGSATLSAVSDNADGTYTATITNSTAEKVTVTAAFGGSNVDDTVDINFIKSKIFDLRSGIATTTHSILTANPSGVVADGTSISTITMQAKDANGNNLTTGGLTVTMSENGSATLSAVSDNANGTYTATITNSTAEKVTVTATFGGSNVGDTADVNFIASEVSDSPVGVATKAHSTLTANPSGVAADGTSTSTITMQAKDANGNNLTTGGLKITMSASGSATLSAVIDNADGTYTATITNSTVEKVTVTAAFGGSNVGDTVNVNFIKSEIFDSQAGIATTTHSILTANPTSITVDNVILIGGVTTLNSDDSYVYVGTDGTSASTITMQARDANGNNLTTGGLTVTMSATGSATLSAVSDNANGTYTATITNSTVETVTVSAAFGGSNVDDTVDVSFAAHNSTPGGGLTIYTTADTTHSTLTANPTTTSVTVDNVAIVDVTTTSNPDNVWVADGTTTSMITMQARDANGNNLTTGGLTVTMSATGSATLSAVSDNADGTYT
ncbi:hypothetical protein BPUTSESOX_291, partial [uncultured Gammaproteobacteria bacterium]